MERCDIPRGGSREKADYTVLFSLPDGLTVGGVTTWSVDMARHLGKLGFSTALAVHSSRYNPVMDFGPPAGETVLDCSHLPHPDDPSVKPGDYRPCYEGALPAVLIPNWSQGAYAVTARMASFRAEDMRVIGMAHSDESGYYQWLVHYEGMIHCFVAVSEEIKARLSRFIPHRAGDIRLKPYPVDAQEELTRTWSGPEAPLRLMYAGRISRYQKRIFSFIELASGLQGEGVNFHLTLIGGGADEAEFSRQVSRLPVELRSRISLPGTLPAQKMAEAWRSADISVLLSAFEGTSISMLESMAQGCIPVVTEVSGASGVISHGENGFMVPVGDSGAMVAILKMLDRNRSLLPELGAHAHRKVREGYSRQKYMEWLSETIEDTWARPARPWPPHRAPEPLETIHRKCLRLTELRTGKSGLERTEKQKKILFVNHDVNRGGAQKVLLSLVKGLDSSRWQPLVLLPGESVLREEYEDIGVETVVTPLEWIVTDARQHWCQYERFRTGLRERVERIADIIDSEQVALVVTNTVCILEGALAARLSGVPHLWNILEMCSQDPALAPLMDYPAFYATIDSLSDRIAVVSRAVEKEITGFFPSRKIEVIHTGLEDSGRTPAADREAFLDIDGDTPVVTCAGVLSERKGVMLLVDVAQEVRRTVPGVRFVMVGNTEGPTFEKMSSQIRQKGLEQTFLFTGFRDDIPEVMASSDVIVVPSMADPLPLVALEAMKCGRPLVGTRSGGLEEMIADGETGFLVPVNSPFEMALAIVRLLENPSLQREMGDKARQRFQQLFGYRDFIKRYESLFEKALLQEADGAPAPPRDSAEAIITMVEVAAEAQAQIASLRKVPNPSEEVAALLDYPGYMPCPIGPVAVEKKRPRASVCIPLYNGAPYIRECVSSILSQRLADFELIIVDDASTDESLKLVRSFGDSRIRCIENPHRLGLIGNWNRCLELSSGEYICIFHQDDVMDAGNLEKKTALLASDCRIGLVYSDTLVINHRGETIADHWFNAVEPNSDFRHPGERFFRLLFENLNVICCPSVVARRDCYERAGGFDSRLPFTGDLEMWLRIALFSDVAYLSEPLVHYRWHENNLTQSYLDVDLIHLYLGRRMALEKYPDRFKDPFYPSLLREDTTARIYDRSVHHYRTGEYRKAKKYLLFLQKIRSGTGEPGLMDQYISQLSRWVDQASALRWLNENGPPGE